MPSRLDAAIESRELRYLRGKENRTKGRLKAFAAALVETGRPFELKLNRTVGLLHSPALSVRLWAYLRRRYALGPYGLRYLPVGERPPMSEKEPPLPPMDESRDRAAGGSTIPPRNQIGVIKGKEKKHRVVGYIRVSTDEQSISKEYQMHILKEWCRRNHAELVAVTIDDGISGATDMMNRPGLAEAIALMRVERCGILLVAKRDRLARNVYVAAVVEETLKKMGAVVYSADGSGNGSSPADEFMRAIMNAAAVFERNLIRERTKAALDSLKRRNLKWSGTLKYGFKLAEDGKTLLKDEAECRIIDRIRELRALGYGCHRIASTLQKEGMLSRTGKRFDNMQIWRMLQDGY